jgi:dolichol-phosphate mannosyltransferase
MTLLSVIIPAYNEQESIDHIVPTLRDILEPRGIPFEIVIIDDGSSDATFEKIKQLSQANSNVRGYQFSRNFGKESAILAGLKESRGSCCVVMDSDFQHPPETLPAMYKLWQEGFEVVEGVKASRGKESIFYKFFSNIFYGIMTKLSGLDMRSSSDFKLLDRRVVDQLNKLDEQNTFFRGLSYWVGFRSTKIEYSVAPRKYGATKWSFLSLTKYALDNIIGFSTAPLHLVTWIGTFLIIASIALGIQTLVRFFMGQSLEGFTTTVLLLLLIGGCLALSLGIIGLYVAKIYEEVKGRPRYIIRDSTEGSEA